MQRCVADIAGRRVSRAVRLRTQGEPGHSVGEIVVVLAYQKPSAGQADVVGIASLSDWKPLPSTHSRMTMRMHYVCMSRDWPLPESGEFSSAEQHVSPPPGFKSGWRQVGDWGQRTDVGGAEWARVRAPSAAQF